MVVDSELAARLTAEPLFIGGGWRAASGAPISVIDPAREETLADVPSAGAAEVHAALQSARTAQAGWAHTSILERGAHLRAIADLVVAHRDTLAELLVSEVGKPREPGGGRARVHRVAAALQRRMGPPAGG